MLVKFFKTSGSGAGLAKYLQATEVYKRDPVTGRNLTKEKKVSREVAPIHLRGDFDQLVQLNQSLSFKQKFTAGVIAFEKGDNPTPEQIQAVIDDFQATMTAGMDADRTLWAWNMHLDKGNVELNFMTSRVDLATGKSFNIQPPNQYDLCNAWRDYWNAKEGWASPTDPSRQIPAKAARGEAPERIETKADFAKHIEALIKNGSIEPTRKGVVDELKKFGKVKESNDFISLKLPNKDRAFRLRGEWFRREFNATPERIAEAAARPPESRSEAIARTLENLTNRRTSRAEYNRNKYGQGFESLGKEDSGQGLVAVPNANANRPGTVASVATGDLRLVQSERPVHHRNNDAERRQPSLLQGSERAISDPVPDSKRREAPLQATLGGLSESGLTDPATSLSKANVSLSGLSKRPNHGLPQPNRPRPQQDAERGVLQEYWESHGQRTSHTVQWVQRLRNQLRNGLNYADRIRNQLAESIGQGFERLKQSLGFAENFNQYTDSADRVLRNRIGGLQREGAAFDDRLRQLEQAVSGGSGGIGRARGLGADRFAEIKDNIEHWLKSKPQSGV